MRVTPRDAPSAIVSASWLRGLLLALFTSNAGTFLQITAQAWFVWEHTHDASMLGLLSLVQTTPLLGVPLLGGLLADRFPRRTVLLVTQATLAMIATLMGALALTGQLAVSLVLVMAGVLATITALDNPVRQVYLPGLVTAPERTRMVGFNALAYNAGAAIGPALAGFLLPIAGAGWCFLVNGASYLVTLGWLLPGPAGRPVPSQCAGVGEALAYLRRAPEVRQLLLLVAIVSLLGRSYVHVLAALVNGSWGAGVGGYSLLAALPGVGAILAAGLVASDRGQQVWSRRPAAGALVLGGAVLGLAIVPSLVVGAVILLVVGVAATGTMTLLNALVQTATPDDVPAIGLEPGDDEAPPEREDVEYPP